jgi:hypothetical protein
VLIKTLAKSGGILAALLARKAVYTLLLQWLEAAGAAPSFSPASFFGEAGSVSEDWNPNAVFLKLIQLASCRSDSARWWLKRSSRTTSSSESSSSGSTRSRRTLKDCLQPLVVSAVSQDAVAGSLPSALHQFVHEQLVQASHRKYAEFLWAEKSYLSHSDAHVLNEPNLNFVQWVTDQLLTKHHASSDAEVDALCMLYDAWAITLRSPSMSLKEHGFRRLCDVLEKVSAIDTTCRIAGDAFAVDWAPFYTLVPAERIEAMATRRLDKEKEDAPRYSRYVQVVCFAVCCACFSV